MNCLTCQAAVQPGTRFCTVCGASLAPPQQPATHQAPRLSEPLGAQSTTIMVVPAPRAKGTALAIEAVAAIFGIFGAGWLYSGNTALGVVLLIAGFMWDLLMLAAVLLSVGFGFFCVAPIHLLLVLGSVLLLSLTMPKTA